jgi:hypothetical protein
MVECDILFCCYWNLWDFKIQSHEFLFETSQNQCMYTFSLIYAPPPPSLHIFSNFCPTPTLTLITHFTFSLIYAAPPPSLHIFSNLCPTPTLFNEGGGGE